MVDYKINQLDKGDFATSSVQATTDDIVAVGVTYQFLVLSHKRTSLKVGSTER
jgi:hypothetical protein